MEKKHKQLAWLESAANVLSGLLLSILIFQPLIFWLEDVNLQIDQNIRIAVYFTIISIIRGYVWRRWFHNKFKHIYFSEENNDDLSKL